VEGDVLCRLLSETCRLVIVGLLEGSPAEAAGFQVGDVVVAVDDDPVVGQTIDAVTLQVRGAAGTEVELAVERAGEDLSITVGRVALDIPVAESRMLADGIGYLQLSTFTDDAGSDVAAELGGLLDAGATTIVLDLQNNPGGSLNAAVAVASQFLDGDLVLRTQTRDDEQRYPVQDGGLATSPDIALLVLVNAGSASASEVVTAALQEAGRATVIGENTFGKNIVQRIFPLPNGGAVKLTIARWVTASGADYGRDGITPDIEVQVPVDAGPDFLVDEALRIVTEGEAP
jgi:carboxyl-terminal processing protease